MLISYPVNMPVPLVSGYKIVDTDRIESGDIGKGIVNFDIVSEHSFFTVNVVWNLSADEFKVFEGWFKHELTFGSKSFLMSVKLGIGLQESELYLNKGYNSILESKRWKVTATLLGINRVYDSLSDYLTIKASLAQTVSMVECGEPLAECGEPFAECGNRTV